MMFIIGMNLQRIFYKINNMYLDRNMGQLSEYLTVCILIYDKDELNND